MPVYSFWGKTFLLNCKKQQRSSWWRHWKMEEKHEKQSFGMNFFRRVKARIFLHRYTIGQLKEYFNEVYIFYFLYSERFSCWELRKAQNIELFSIFRILTASQLRQLSLRAILRKKAISDAYSLWFQLMSRLISKNLILWFGRNWLILNLRLTLSKFSDLCVR